MFVACQTSAASSDNISGRLDRRPNGLIKRIEWLFYIIRAGCVAAFPLSTQFWAASMVGISTPAGQVRARGPVTYSSSGTSDTTL